MHSLKDDMHRSSHFPLNTPGLHHQHTDLSQSIPKVGLQEEPAYLRSVPASVRRANATFYMLCRNSDLKGALESMRQVEKRFNWRYGYPWTFLNEEEFTEEFKE
jgi:hypothetical protein